MYLWNLCQQSWLWFKSASFPKKSKFLFLNFFFFKIFPFPPLPYCLLKFFSPFLPFAFILYLQPYLWIHLKDITIKTQLSGEDQDGRVGGCGVHLPLLNTSKIHLHVEQSSLQTNWRLSERLLYNQVWRYIHTELCRKGRNASVPLGGGGITQAWRSSLKSEWFEPHTDFPSPGV